ncbi:hypothetical protein BU23DRAFT_88017 [Bimuria novae-zelandiae CBS 107.79]|uniref:Uncharacterized protein n=1 Tax=Bimuria novae-zelandiae CBS 107.79 TaxID=1447943 RepID=A0A6A5VJB9_9PLEO|nr:hypothetical protein BU23DRAFT_88017 [Bimuria novae-zelandiae CBS 107.79]
MSAIQFMLWISDALVHHKLDFAVLLSWSPNFRASNPRDKVFALLGLPSNTKSVTLIADATSVAVALADERSGFTIGADYQSSIRDVYIEATYLAMTQDTSFRLLSYAGNTGPRTGYLPSWVSDFSYEGAQHVTFCCYTKHVSRLNSAGGDWWRPEMDKEFVSLLQSDILLISGQFVDEIGSYTSVHFTSTAMPPVQGNKGKPPEPSMQRFKEVIELVSHRASTPGVEGTANSFNQQQAVPLAAKENTDHKKRISELAYRLWRTLIADNIFKPGNGKLTITSQQIYLQAF